MLDTISVVQKQILQYLTTPFIRYLSITLSAKCLYSTSTMVDFPYLSIRSRIGLERALLTVERNSLIAKFDLFTFCFLELVFSDLSP